MKFNYIDWVLDNGLMLSIILIPIYFIVMYFVLNSEDTSLFKGVTSAISTIIVLVVLPSLFFILFAGGYVQDYRDSFKDFIESKGRYSVEIQDVAITNNNGDYISKFSEKDENKYVKIYYFQGGTEKSDEIVNSEPELSEDGKYHLNFVRIDRKFEIKYKGYTGFLMRIRKILGYNDEYKLNFDKGAYDMHLEVPENDFDEIKEEMNRKEK